MQLLWDVKCHHLQCVNNRPGMNEPEINILLSRLSRYKKVKCMEQLGVSQDTGPDLSFIVQSSFSKVTPEGWICFLSVTPGLTRGQLTAVQLS